MTMDDIIRMAREADLLTTTEPNGYQVWIPENLERFANLVAAAEREACAKLFESYEIFGEDYDSYYADKYAALIRARGQE